MDIQEAAVKRGKTLLANQEIENGPKRGKMQLAPPDSGCPSSLRHDMLTLTQSLTKTLIHHSMSPSKITTHDQT